MDVEILSVNKNDNSFELSQKSDEIRSKLQSLGCSLTYINSLPLKSAKIKSAVDVSASNPEKPDIIIIANALTTQDSTSFKKYFAETVAGAEHAENEPAPKDYWKRRNEAYRSAKKNNATEQELEALADEFRMYRKKSRIFCLGDFGNGYKGYCFMYNGVKVGVLPQALLTGAEIKDVIALAVARINDVFENSAEDYPGGFSNREYVPEKTGFANRFIPMRGDTRREVGRKCVVILSFLVFLAALAFLAYNMIFLSLQNAQLNGEIQKIAHGTEDNTEEQKPDVSEGIDWEKLKDINNEIVGWIQIDDTQVDYPVLWHESDDRNYQFYLSHNYKKDYDSYGSIFVDYRCTKGTASKNLVMHGHHMNDGSMFGELMKYGGTTGNLDFYKKVPTIEFDTPDGNATYKIISVFKTNTLSSQGEFFNYMIGNFQNDKDFMNYVYNVRIRSMFNCPVDVNEDDELITLSTCSYEFTNFRTVVVARKVRADESKKVDVSEATLNKNAVWPDVYYSVYGGSRPKVTDFCTAYEDKQIDWYNGDYDFKDQKVQEPSSTEPTTNSKDDKVQMPTQKPTDPIVYHTVTFINYDGSEIETQQVEDGKAAKAPKDPEKPSDDWYDYKFTGWQMDFSNVTSGMTIAPNFEAVLKPEFQNGG